MGDTFKKVQSGDPLRTPAETFNTFVDAARDFKARRQSRTREPLFDIRQTGIIPVKNNSGADRNRFDVLEIDRPIFTPIDSLASFQDRVALVGAVPTEADHFGRFVVLLEPLRAGAIGQACVSGVWADWNCHAAGLHAIPPGGWLGEVLRRNGTEMVLWCQSCLRKTRRHFPGPKRFSDVAVVIACHNYGRFLGTAVGSVLAQTHAPVEILVVDDASDDETRQVAERFADDGVRVIHMDFGNWQIDRRYDRVLCLQVLEHIDDPAAFAQKRFECGSTVIISVPYRWPATACSEHVHDPVDEAKLKAWTGREPTAWNIVESRLVAIYSKSASDPLAAEFDARGEWVTRCRINGCLYAGCFLAEDDPRLAAFLKRCPNPGRVLELGCLEGGHSFALVRIAEHVVAVDGREANLEHARRVQQILGATNVSFLRTNLETDDLTDLGCFDQIFNSGVLYHLPRPWELLRRLAIVGREMFLCTHLAPRAEVEQNGYRGIFYAEREGPKGGMSGRSFWLLREDLLRMLADCGFGDIDIVNEFPTRLGPYIWLWCRSRNGPENKTPLGLPTASIRDGKPQP